MTIFGVPYERVVLGVVWLLAFAACYDMFVVDWLETHKPFLPAQTAVEVVIGVFVVLLVFLLSVRDSRLSGIDSFSLLLLFFAVAGAIMALGSRRRTLAACSSGVR